MLRVNYLSQMGLDDQIGYEYRALKFLQPSGRVPKPRYLDSSKQLCGHGALVMDYYEGEWLDYEIPGNVVEAARMLADVHAVPVDEGCPLQRPGDPLRAQFEVCARFFDNYRHSALADERVVNAIQLMQKATRAALEMPFDPDDSAHALNTEAVAVHFLIPQDGLPGHMVDWEKPLVGLRRTSHTSSRRRPPFGIPNTYSPKPTARRSSKPIGRKWRVVFRKAASISASTLT